MIVTGIAKRAITVGDFADLTPVPVVDVRWRNAVDDELVLEVEFASDLTPQAAADVQRRIESRNLNEETIRTQAVTALQNNRDFNLIVGPTNAQTLAQVKALSRQMNGVIRLLLGQLDGTN